MILVFESVPRMFLRLHKDKLNSNLLFSSGWSNYTIYNMRICLRLKISENLIKVLKKAKQNKT